MADVNSDDYYKVLGVPRDATEQVIKKAYRKMVSWYQKYCSATFEHHQAKAAAFWLT
jgi:DnaJ-domain-containing protein 1